MYEDYDRLPLQDLLKKREGFKNELSVVEFEIRKRIIDDKKLMTAVMKLDWQRLHQLVG